MTKLTTIKRGRKMARPRRNVTLTDRVRFGKQLRAKRELLDLTMDQLSAMTGRSVTSLVQWENGHKYPEKRPSRDSVLLLAQALRTEPDTWLKMLNLENDDGDDHDRPDFETYVSEDPHLTNDQKRHLVELYHMLTRSMAVDD